MGVFNVIALVCEGTTVAVKDKTTHIVQNLPNYFNLLLEIIENQAETFYNLSSKENLTTQFKFIKKCGILGLTFPPKFYR